MERNLKLKTIASIVASIFIKIATETKTIITLTTKLPQYH